jgi:hypothetical protein
MEELIRKSLSVGEVLDPCEGIVLLAIVDSGVPELPGKEFVAVQADLDGEGKP